MTEITMNMMNTDEVKTHETFRALFPIRPELLTIIEEDMKTWEYDESQPIVLATWEGQDEPVCIDGHTRLQAAKNAGIMEVPVYAREYSGEEAAIEHAIELQCQRRKLTDAEFLRLMERQEIARRSQSMEMNSQRTIPLKLQKLDLDLVERPVSEFLGQNGRVELKKLILERRLPIYRADDGSFCTEYVLQGLSMAEQMLIHAREIKASWGPQNKSAECLLRAAVRASVWDFAYYLEDLAAELEGRGEYSSVIEEKIDLLAELNCELPDWQSENNIS